MIAYILLNIYIDILLILSWYLIGVPHPRHAQPGNHSSHSSNVLLLAINRVKCAPSFFFPPPLYSVLYEYCMY